MSLQKLKNVDICGLDDSTNDNGDIKNKFVNLISKEGECFEISKNASMMSNLIKAIVEGDSKEKDIPLEKISSRVMKKIIEFMKYYEDKKITEIEKPIQTTNIRFLVSDWDADFINVDNNMLFELIATSNYLDIKPLLDLSCAKIATMIKGKSIENIRNIFQ